MTMDTETRNKIIEMYLDDSETEFDRILEAADRKQRRRATSWTAVLAAAAAAGIAIILWLAPLRPAPDYQLTPVQIAEGIQQMMLLDIGEIESIVATPAGSYAILTAQLKDGNTCAYILQCDGKDGNTTLLAYNDNQ